jgi:hypothetical protein
MHVTIQGILGLHFQHSIIMPHRTLRITCSPRGYKHQLIEPIHPEDVCGICREPYDTTRTHPHQAAALPIFALPNAAHRRSRVLWHTGMAAALSRHLLVLQPRAYTTIPRRRSIRYSMCYGNTRFPSRYTRWSLRPLRVPATNPRCTRCAASDSLNARACGHDYLQVP